MIARSNLHPFRAVNRCSDGRRNLHAFLAFRMFSRCSDGWFING